MCWVQYADIVNIHQRQNILLGLALTEQTISLKTTPRSSYTQLLNQDGCVLHYKTFSFPPPACLPHSLSIDYHSATWKFPEGNYLAAIQDINKNCSFLWQVAVFVRGGGTNTGQMNLCRLCHSPCSSFDSPLALLLPARGLAEALGFSGATCCLWDWYFFCPQSYGRWSAAQMMQGSAVGEPCGVVGAHHLCSHMVAILLNHILMKKGKLGHSLCFH